MNFENFGAWAFGAVVGWYIYYVNRYRKDASAGDITTLVSAIGGTTITALFKQGTLFGYYCTGLFCGFFGYLVMLVILVRISSGIFDWTFFLDGRRKKLREDEERPNDQKPTFDE